MSGDNAGQSAALPLWALAKQDVMRAPIEPFAKVRSSVWVAQAARRRLVAGMVKLATDMNRISDSFGHSQPNPDGSWGIAAHHTVCFMPTPRLTSRRATATAAW